MIRRYPLYRQVCSTTSQTHYARYGRFSWGRAKSIAFRAPRHGSPPLLHLLLPQI